MHCKRGLTEPLGFIAGGGWQPVARAYTRVQQTMGVDEKKIQSRPCCRNGLCTPVFAQALLGNGVSKI